MSDGKPRYVVTSIDGGKIAPDPGAGHTAREYYVLDRAYNYKIVAAFIGTHKFRRPRVERAAHRLCERLNQEEYGSAAER